MLLGVGPLPETPEQRRDLIVQMESALARAAAGLRAPRRLRVEPAGDPVRAILHAAAEEHVERIVVATVPKRVSRSVLTSDTTSELMRRARLPVTVIEAPPDADDTTPVI